jgi:hypothetical protein
MGNIMSSRATGLVVVIMLLLLCAEVLADRMCARCNAKAESERWVYCPYCGTKYEGGSLPPDATTSEDRYERVSWEKIKLDFDKFNHRCVRFEVRFNGIQNHFAPAERIGITERDYINFYFIGNWTNYVKQSNTKLAEKIKRLTPYTTVTLLAQITVLKNPGSDPIIVVIVDDIDV